MVKALMLGETCLDEYVSKSVDTLNEARKKEISGLIEEIESKELLNVEQLPLKLLKIQRAQYPTIDPSFLSMHNNINYEGEKIKVPKFSVYKKIEEGFDDFSISIWGVWDQKSPTKYGFMMTINKENELPKIFEEPLVKSLGRILKDGAYRNGYDKTLATSYQRILHAHGRLDYMLNLVSQFHGFLPQKLKEKIKETEPIFKRDLYLIAETKPEAWSVTKIIRDPLLVGVIKNKCFLIDHFNTTPIEHYVKSEFTE